MYHLYLQELFKTYKHSAGVGSIIEKNTGRCTFEDKIIFQTIEAKIAARIKELQYTG